MSGEGEGQGLRPRGGWGRKRGVHLSPGSQSSGKPSGFRQAAWSVPIFFFFSCFLGLHSWHMEVSRLGVQSELRLLATATATTTSDPSHVCDLHHSSGPRQIFNPLSEARDGTRNLMVPSQIHFRCTTTGTPSSHFKRKLLQSQLGAPVPCPHPQTHCLFPHLWFPLHLV